MRAFHRVAGLIGLLLLLTGPAYAEVRFIELKDGTSFLGHVTREGDMLRVQLADVVVDLRQSEIERSLTLEEVRSAFATQKEKTDARDVSALFSLAIYAYDRGLTQEAQQAVDQLLKLEPQFAPALELSRAIADRKVQLANPPEAVVSPAERSASAAAAELPAATQPAATQPSRPVSVRAPLPLTDEEINRIRLREIYTGDQFQADNVRVQFRRNVLDDFLKSVEGVDGFRSREDIRQFRGQRPHEQLYDILRNTKPEQLEAWESNIIVQNDPTSIDEFRRRVLPIVLRNCATSACHGSSPAPGFAWDAAASPRPGTYYANFLELEARSYAVGARQMYLVDRKTPDDSLLLHYMVPQDSTDYPHPRVQGYPIQTYSSNSDVYENLARWIGLLKYPPKPDYGVTVRRVGDPPAAPAPQAPAGRP